MRKMMTLLLAMLFALGIFAALAQSADMSTGAATMQQAAKEDRVSGTILRSNKDKSMLVVKERRSEIERVVFYTASTKWTKEQQPADMAEFKDGLYVICLGKLNEKGELTATRIDLQKQ
jgi:hypothetical protein